MKNNDQLVTRTILKEELKKELKKELNKALQPYATKEDVKEAVDQGIYILKVLLEEIRHIIQAGEERDQHYIKQVQNHEKRIVKIEDKLKFYP